VLIDRVAGYAQPSSNQTDVNASIPLGAPDHNTGFLPDRRTNVLGASIDAITGMGLQHILDALPDNLATGLRNSILNSLAKLL